MDFNWATYALSVTGVLLGAWLAQILRLRPGWSAAVVSFACLVVAGFCSAAPIRGIVDPDYVGFGFGYISTGAGISTTIAAGAIFLSAVSAMLIALRNSPGPHMWFVALTSAFFAVNLGGSWLESTFTDMSQNRIQFGEYLTIPGSIGTILQFALLVVPFLYGSYWAPRRSAAHVQSSPASGELGSA